MKKPELPPGYRWEQHGPTVWEIYPDKPTPLMIRDAITTNVPTMQILQIKTIGNTHIVETWKGKPAENWIEHGSYNKLSDAMAVGAALCWMGMLE